MVANKEKEQYKKDLEIYGCGYWSLCLEHDCPCHPTARVNQGFSMDTWNRMKLDMEAQLEDYYGPEYIEDDYWPEDDDTDWPMDYDEYDHN